MKITKVTVNRGATINIGNYESIRADVQLTADVDEHEDWDKVYEKVLLLTESKLKMLVDDVELGQRNASSKAGRFGL